MTRGSFPLDDWQQVAEAELATLGPEDAERRAEAAARLAGLPEPYQLFGVPDEIDGVTALVRAQERP